MDWNGPAWGVSVAAVVASGLVAWLERNWTTRPGLAMGFANHGGMWGDLILLPMANAVIVPHLTFGSWVVPAITVSTLASLAVHKFWYHPPSPDTTPPDATPPDATSPDTTLPDAAVTNHGEMTAQGSEGDHIWPAHARGTWARDMSWSGWAHVAYVAGELTLLCGFVLHTMPPDVVLFVSVIFTVHVPIGLLQPRWFRTGHIATVSEQPLLAPLLVVLWTVALVKL